MNLDLEQRIRDVLARLATLSEAPASNLEPATSHGKAGSSIPAGVSLRHDPNRPPPKERSLHDWYSWQFAAAADNPDRLLALCYLAEVEAAERTHRSPDRLDLRSGALTDNDVQDGGAAERAAAERVVEWYEGQPPVLVALLENTTEAWVRKARRMHGRDPGDGRPRAEFLGWSDDERRRQVAALKARGMGQKAVADRLRVSKRTVQTYWPREHEAVAA